MSRHLVQSPETGKEKNRDWGAVANHWEMKRTMQDCFREHPEIYGSELEEDDAPPEEVAPAPAPPPDSGDGVIPAAATSAIPESQPPPSSSPDPLASAAGTTDTQRAQAAKQQVEKDHGSPISESNEMVPKAAHDATSANTGN